MHHPPFKHFEALVVEGSVVICVADGFPPPQDPTLVMGVPCIIFWVNAHSYHRHDSIDLSRFHTAQPFMNKCGSSNVHVYCASFCTRLHNCA
jgi:hypothetical protein